MKTIEELAREWADKNDMFKAFPEAEQDEILDDVEQAMRYALTSLLADLPEPQTQPSRSDYGYSEGQMDGRNGMLNWIKSLIQNKLK